MANVELITTLGGKIKVGNQPGRARRIVAF